MASELVLNWTTLPLYASFQTEGTVSQSTKSRRNATDQHAGVEMATNRVAKNRTTFVINYDLPIFFKKIDVYYFQSKATESFMYFNFISKKKLLIYWCDLVKYI